MRQKLVIGNWKMHGGLAVNTALLSAIRADLPIANKAAVAVCVPYPYLSQAQQLLKETVLAWGAQDISEHDQGAWTGEVSGSMLADFGSRYVLVGHSERRSFFAETDAVVAAKFFAAQRADLIPVLCVGETLAEREAGITQAVITRQLDVVLALVGIASFAKAVVAYEPVWAIGTGKTATPEQAQAVHVAIRARFAQEDENIASGLQILYGGSVKPSNAVEIFAQPDIDGGLIGGASLVAAEFLAICTAV